ncbi:carbohydrate kinase family protein [Parasulfitobacter algicola]|uniref:Carbohydrate kinase n=1 Tax=Parasulfitobacter algicola TaxID=2614809 RepID=A0ABX2IUR1_9RHOB|nr:carbohydrate kinase [Sulfitobacter algicola]NSX56642.1 carbohydrate kinase [Sulfitobacter algicola]
MPKLWFLGEALIDFVPAASDNGPAFAPRCGGSPYNATKAAALQDVSTGFLGPLSTDMFGDKLAQDLQSYGVDISGTARSDHPTTLAFVDLDGAEPRYAFYNAMTVNQLFDTASISADIQIGDVLHIGSISLIDLPGADNIADFVRKNADGLTISIDPNARPGMIKDMPAWRSRLMDLLGLAKIIKLSDEDLAVLAPDTQPQDFAETLITKGAQLVVFTQGSRGALAFSAAGQASAAVPKVDLVDTVGAGDTVMGTVLAELWHQGWLTDNGIASLTSDQLALLLQKAMAAAAINCTRSGCNPPSRSELHAFLADR